MTTPLSPEAVAQMVADITADRATGMPDHGGWAWFGGRDHVYLATRSGGRRYVMDFVRKGMKSAQPRFQIKGIMHNAVDDLTMYQVGDGIARGQKQADADPSVYRLDVSGIDHPDARRMQRIPDMERAILTLAAENATLRASEAAALERGRKALETAKTRHIGDQPSYSSASDLGWAHQEYASLRRDIIAALTPTADRTEYERKVAQMKEDFPNGI